MYIYIFAFFQLTRVFRCHFTSAIKKTHAGHGNQRFLTQVLNRFITDSRSIMYHSFGLPNNAGNLKVKTARKARPLFDTNDVSRPF